ncbi:porin family protein [Pelagibacterium xiamenense]|uniref:porin family protein n=1 Tax=Pelagibacterium xiamenense TaxID=2901140 RepID=UPI001E38EA48|nr:porin family protein [Pelagibacterium xiamenense]MCD7060629.1 porin family protein [Pelagibacterium xiamenense]
MRVLDNKATSAFLSWLTLLTGVVLASTAASAQTGPCADAGCTQGVPGAAAYESQSGSMPVGENTESGVPSGSIPFRISVDGQPLDASAPIALADVERSTDLALSAVDIQVKYDGLDTTPVLNVVTEARRTSYAAGDPVRFRAYVNYPAFVAQAEVRIYDAGAGSADRPLAVLPSTPWDLPQWRVPDDEASEYAYVLRVYDAQGRFDQTAPLPIVKTTVPLSGDGRFDPRLPDLDTDRTAIRNIQVYGGAVTVYGRNVPEGFDVYALGEMVPVDGNRSFVIRRIMPAGQHAVDVNLTGYGKGSTLQFVRDVTIPENDWFYVALADLTIGRRMGDEMIENVRPGEYDAVYSEGRLAFYLKGKIRGEYLLTAAADTGEEGLGSLFSNLGDRDPRALLRHLDPDDYYPVYGDDSSMIEDAPTSGKFYVRLERGDSHAMWGNYQTSITGTEFMRTERMLYGANAVYRSDQVTGFGERQTEVTVYAALPDTLPQREEFLATGGSAYFLQRQDITIGSETITVEVRNSVSGRVIERRVLRYGEDYTIDYLQGVVILARPLPWFTGSGSPVQPGAGSGDAVYMVAQYEYVPSAEDLDGYSLGGRAQHWFNDHVRIGVTGLSETTGIADQTAVGVDAQLRYSETTFLRAEIARSEGPGFGSLRSVDGGLTWGEQGISWVSNRAAWAWRVEGQADLADLGTEGLAGTVEAYYEEKDEGFATLSQEVQTDQWAWGLSADVALSETFGIAASYDDFGDADGDISREGDASLTWQIDDYLSVAFGLGYTELMSPDAISAGKSGYDGSRLDAGARLTYEWDEDMLAYVFGQTTLARDGDIDRNDRTGVGVEFQLTETLSVSGEISYGTHGLGVLASLGYDPNDDEHYYIGYRLDPNRAFDLDQTFDLLGEDHGTIVTGLQRRLNEVASTYAETSYDMFGGRRSLTQTYGVLLTPDAFWSVDVGLVAGQVRDDTIDPVTGLQRADFDRVVPSVGIGYVNEETGIRAHANAEVRLEESSDGSRNQNSYLLNSGLSWKTSDDWRLLANINAVLSDATAPETAFGDTDYVEASFGYAYRPVDNERLNALFRYTWLYDLPGNNQVTSGSASDQYAPAQRSHILSADVNYDLTPWLTLGGKYGFRYGEIRYRTDNGSGTAFENTWQVSSAHLAIIRADLHVVKNWDVLIEGRVMHMPEAQTTDYGALAAAYRHFGDNFKVGLGYNFGRFSDDLRDLTLDDRGVFINIVGKF